MNPFQSSICLVILAVLASAAATAIEPNSFTEDFAATTYLDAANSTALWDSGLGQIRLPDLPLEVLKTLYTTGSIADSEPYGPYHLLCVGTVLGVVDVTDPGTADIVEAVGLTGTGTGLTAAGRYAYIACGTAGLDVVDLGDPLAGARVGHWATTLNTRDVVFSGGHLFVPCGTELDILDVSDPTNPVMVGSYNRTSNDVAVAGSLAFVAAGTNGLRVLDVSDPTSPVNVAYVTFGAAAVSVDVDGDLACVAAGTAGLVTIDISDPLSPAVLTTVPMVNAGEVRIDGGYAYVAEGGTGGKVFDISDPLNPELLGTHMPATHDHGAFIPYGRKGYVTDYYYHTLEIIEIAKELETPYANGGIDLGMAPWDTAVCGTTAAAALGTGGLALLDIADPSSIHQVGTFGGYVAQDVCIAGNHAYLAAGTDGFVILDITDPSSPQPVAVRSGVVTDVAVDGRYAYVADAGNLKSYDVSDPANPVLADTYSYAGFYALKVSVEGNYAAVVSLYTDYEIVAMDITDPAKLARLGTSDTGYIDLQDIVLRGSWIFAAGDAGLVVYTINQSGGLDLHFQDATYDLRKIVVAGDRLYASGAGGIEVYDIADPADPVHLNTIAGSYRGLARRGDHLLAGPYSSGQTRMIEVTQRRFDTAANVIQSLPVYSGSMHPARVLRSAQTNGAPIAWEASTDGGSTWDPLAVVTELTWPAGTELRWRATLGYPGSGINPTCTSLNLEWWFEAATIRYIEDIPNDQGRQVRIGWSRSGFDTFNASRTVTSYLIYRLIDDPAAAGMPAKAIDYWDFITAVPAVKQDSYAMVVPTLADSTVSGGQHLSTFHIQTIFNDPFNLAYSPSESGYSLDNLAPSIPQGAAVDGDLLITWDDPIDPDFRYFTVYGSSTGSLDGSEVVIGHAVGTQFDATGEAHAYYLLTATDFSGNESAPAVLDSGLSGVGGALPTRTALVGNHPNPFNPKTVIAFDLAEDLPVRLEIYDLKGRLVRRLETGSVWPAGRNEAAWDGRDEAGRQAASGNYVYRLEAGRVVQTRSMALVR